MNIKAKKALAARILGVGVGRVRIDPKALDKVRDAITRQNIRALLDEGVIWAVPSRGSSRGRIRQRERGKLGAGSRKGALGARRGKKRGWVRRIVALRRVLKRARDKGELPKEMYRSLYRQVRGGQVRSVHHLSELITRAAKR